ncbi:hypothetical protein [Micromonospora sp. NBC_00860]|uniref:hypothetical protein n=1 Tax=Micromonospora sp. NBC_00860 TaxID=2975980 RepID=UPI00386DC279|nr:hypothetical protein OH804_08695 [Micromonospora sp. NBC_00860]
MGLGVGPLLQLDDDVGIVGRPGVHTGKHHVHPLAGQRQLVLDQHLHLAQTRVGEILPQHRQAVRPGTTFCRTHIATDLLHDPVCEQARATQAQQTIGRHAKC